MRSPENLSLAKLLLFHGLVASPQEFGLIAHSIRSKGLPYEAVTVPGYTLASGLAPDWRHWLTAATSVLDTEAPGNAPVVLGGLCMGGVLAAALALRAPERVAGLVLMSPSFEFDGWGVSPLRDLRNIGY